MLQPYTIVSLQALDVDPGEQLARPRSADLQVSLANFRVNKCQVFVLYT